MFYTESEFIAALQLGQCGVYPTDTVPGLGALPSFAASIYVVKQRELTKPLILLAASLEDIYPLCQGWQPEWEDVARQYWPGALTLVLPASQQVPSLMQQVGMVGVRIPNHPSALALLRQTGPLATTSINQSGQPALTDPTMILREFPELPLLQGHYGEQNLPSTIVRWQNNAWEVLRQGSVLWPPSPL